MKAKDFQDALTNVNDKYIEEAATYKRSVKGLKVWRVVAIAASCLLVVSLGLVLVTGLLGSAKSGNGAYSGGAAYPAETNAAMPPSNSAKDAHRNDSYYSEGKTAMDEPADQAYENEAEYSGAGNESATGGNTGAASAVPSIEQGAKIIYTSTIDMQSEEFDTTVARIDEMVSNAGGYYESKTVSDSNGSYRTASFVIRVPAGNYDGFIKDLENTATITYQYQEAEDVSDYYYDIQSRLDTAKTKLKRLQDLLAQAEDMADIITIENAISDTEWEIDDLQGSLNYFDSRISYSTLYIDLREVYKVEPVITPPMTFGEKISAAFHDGLEGFTDGMGELAIWFAESWTWLLLVVVIHVVIFLIIFLSVRRGIRRRARKE